MKIVVKDFYEEVAIKYIAWMEWFREAIDKAWRESSGE